jgi:hypothetical protein
MTNSDLSFWFQWYLHYYEAGIFSLEHLKEKLKKLESVEHEWANHCNRKSYYMSVKALRMIIDKIQKETNK